MVVVQEEAQIEVVFLVHPPEALEEGLGHFLPVAGLTMVLPEAILGIHAISSRRTRRGEHVDGCRRVSPVSLLGELEDGLVSRVQDDACTSAEREGDVFLAAGSCLLCCFWGAGAQRRRIRRVRVKLEAGTPARSSSKELRGAAVPSGGSTLEIRDVVVVLRDAVDETGFLSKTQALKS